MSEEIALETNQVFDPKSEEPVKLASYTDGSEKETAPQNDAEWYLAPDVPGVGEIPEWYDKEKFPTVLDLAKGASSLRKKLGAFTGAPEEYELSLPEDFPKDVQINADDPLLTSFKEFAKEANMSQESFNKVVDLYLNQYKEMAANDSKETESFYKQELEKLGDDYQEKLDVVNQWAKNNLPDDLYKVFYDSAVSADMIKLFDYLRENGRASTIPKSTQPHTQLTREMITERLKDPRYFQGGEFANKTNQMYIDYYNAHPDEL